MALGNVTINSKPMNSLEDIEQEVRVLAYPPVTVVNDPDDSREWDAQEFLIAARSYDTELNGNYFTFTAEEWERETELANA